MARLIYSGLMSVDGYIADRDGNFDWAEPDAEVHSFVNEQMRPAGTHLLGRRMYEVMAAWEAPGGLRRIAELPAYIRDFAELWKAADKVVFSRTLQAVTTARTRIEREFSAGAAGQLKARRRQRPGGGRRGARRGGHPGRAGGRVPDVPLTRGCGRRQALPPGRRPPPA